MILNSWIAWNSETDGNERFMSVSVERNATFKGISREKITDTTSMKKKPSAFQNFVQQ